MSGRAARAALLSALIAVAPAAAAWAGPPFLTDDPEPTDTGHWEIYGPEAKASGVGADYNGAFGAEINYGAAPDVQLTIGLPAAYTHAAGRFHAGRGDLELSVKYRVVHDEAARLSVAVFPGVTLPTASHDFGSGRVTALLPVWAQKDFGAWSVFGGGGYAFNPGPGARNYWTGGIAVSRQVCKRLLLGVEADRQGADTRDGHGATSLGMGAIVQLKPPFRLLASAGPTFADSPSATGFHSFIALGVDL